MEELFILLGIYQLKHFVSDYPLQGVYMLGKAKKENWFLPLLAHASVHGAGTLIITLLFAPSLWWLSIVDLVVHFSMDRIKASPNILNRFKPDNKFFWWCLGFDQMVHHLTHYFIIWMIINH